MVYLTFFTSYAVAGEEMLKADSNSYGISKYYDVLHISSDPRPFIQKNEVFPSSSITLNYLGDQKELLPYIYLLILEPGAEIEGTEPLEGVYSHLLTSSNNIFDQLEKTKGIQGILDLKLEEESPICLSETKKGSFRAANSGLCKEPTKKEVEDYLSCAQDLAKDLDSYSPSYIIAPAPHGVPIATSTLWFSQSERAYRVYFPVAGNYMHSSNYDLDEEIVELSSRLSYDEHKKLCYIHSLVSGESFMHGRQLVRDQYLWDIDLGKTELVSMGIAHDYESMLEKERKVELQREVERGSSKIRSTKNLFTSVYEAALLDDAYGEGSLEANKYRSHVFPILDKKGRVYDRSDLLKKRYRLL